MSVSGFTIDVSRDALGAFVDGDVLEVHAIGRVVGAEDSNLSSRSDINRLAYDGAILVPIAVP